MNDILMILTTEDRGELKAGVKALILNHFKNDLDALSDDSYCFNPEYIESLVTDAFEQIMDDLKPKLKKDVEKKMKQLVNSINSIDALKMK